MQAGWPTPFTPARNIPPPVPPPSPGPRPPPEPLPMPPPWPVPMPPPPPGPPEKLTEAASGSPMLLSAGLLTFKSGGPRSEGSIGSLGFGFLIVATGGVYCVHWNFGARPFVGGNCSWVPPPPPPPALLAPAGSLAMYGEMSRIPTSPCLFFAWVDGTTLVQIGTAIIANTTNPCRAMAIA